MKTEFALPTEEKITLLALGRGSNPQLIYLHTVRRGTATEDQRLGYENMRKFYAKKLADVLAELVPDADALIMPPSSRDDVLPYRDAILNRLSGVTDLCAGISRQGKVKAANNDTTLEELIDDIAYTAVGKESAIKSLVIVDERVGTGKTAAAILRHLRAKGLGNSDKCRVTLVAPLKVE